MVEVDVCWAGKRDAQVQLTGLMEEMRTRKMCLEELERRSVAAALVEERMRYCVLVGCLKPLAVRDIRSLRFLSNAKDVTFCAF